MYIYRLSNELAARGHAVTVVSTASTRFDAAGGADAVESPHEHANVDRAPVSAAPRPLSPLVTYLSGRPGLQRPPAEGHLRVSSVSTSSTSTSSRSSAGPACSTSAATRSSSTRRTSTGSSARCTTLWKQDRELVRAARVPPLHALLPPAAAALALHRPARARARERRPVPLAEPLRRSTSTAGRGFCARCGTCRTSCRSTRRSASNGDPSTAAARPYFLFVGRLVQLKGVADADRGVPSLRRRRPPDRGRRHLRRRAPRLAADLRARSLPRPRASGRAPRAVRGRGRRCSCPRSSTRRSASSRSRRSRSARP